MTTIEYPRSQWDDQRVAFLSAVQRARSSGWITTAVVTFLVLVAGVVMSSGLDDVIGALVLSGVVGTIAVGVCLSLMRKGDQRRAVRDIREALSHSGQSVTEDQAGILLGLGCCWLADHRYLEADLSGTEVVVLRVLEPPRENLAWGWFGGGGGGGDGGGGC